MESTEEPSFIDWDQFDSLIEVTGGEDDPSALRQIFETYELDAYSTLDHVESLSTDEHAETKRLLHRIKGSSGSVGFTGAMTAIRQLHDLDASPPDAERKELIKEIRNAVAFSLQSIRRRHSWLNADPM
ncbi:MAG: hypothetical protein SynsKO_36180 [Synoicihabitans sp.]